MKTNLRTILSLSFCCVSLSSCVNLEEMNIDPNHATSTDPQLLLTNVEYKTFSGASKSPAYATRQLVMTDGENTYQVYKWNHGSFDTYSDLRDVEKLIKNADDQPVYTALANFIRAYDYYNLALTFGDVPCAEALKGETDNLYQPRYDTQEKVLTYVLKQLEEANTILVEHANETINGDIIFDGNLTKWRKVINAFRLKVLMTLSKRNTIDGTSVKSAFASIVSNQLLMQSDKDNGQLVFIDQQDNRYPFFNDSGFGSGLYMDSTYIANLRIRKDPRLFAFCTQTPAAKEQGKAIDDYTAYDGGDPIKPYAMVNKKATNHGCSKPQPRYYQNATNEPLIFMGYTEQQLILCEAVVRGWIDGNAKDYYDSAVKASFSFYNAYATDFSSYLTPEAAETYLTGDLVRWNNASTTEEKIAKIVMQKYIPSFLQGGQWSMIYEYHRTGYPKYLLSSNMMVGARWMYPLDEYNNNTSNLKETLTSQYAGNDNITDLSWCFK